MFDPTVEQEPLVGSLADDIQDIYSDLKRGLLLLEHPQGGWQSAVWDWRFHLESHWGAHAVNALRFLHFAAVASSRSGAGDAG